MQSAEAVYSRHYKLEGGMRWFASLLLTAGFLLCQNTAPQTAVRRNNALTYYRQQNLPAAIRELEALHAAVPDDLAAVAMLADCYTRSGQADKALSLLRPIANAHPRDAAVKYQLGSALIRAGKPEEALDPLEQAGKLAKSADALLLAGATALGLGQFQRAHADLEEALRLNSATPGVWTWAGMARDRVSDEDGAKDAFRKALTADPNDFEAVFHLGAILYRERDIESARPLLEHAVALQPSSPLARYALALVRSAGGDTETAVHELEAVIAMAPNWPEPHVKLASLYFRLRRKADGEREQQIVETLRAEHREKRLEMPALDKQ
jgi:Flp pilus assembly protein TadD